MSLTFLHTADWQLGKPFASIRDEANRNRVRQERLETVRRLGELARETGAAFVLVAGDIFDSSQATKATVSAACAAIGAIPVPVLAIPGNHDHGGPGSLWDQEFFRREQAQLAPNLRLLLTPEPVVLERAVLLPAPLLRRHEPGDPTAWIRRRLAAGGLPEDRPRVVLAHGTVQGFGSGSESEPDEEDTQVVNNRIDLAALPLAELDYVALGDWHGTKEVGPKAWYSGTPETDRFPKAESNDPGNVLKVTLAGRGQPPLVEKIPVGRLRWRALEFRFSDDASLELLKAGLDERIGARGGEHLLRLTLEGSLGLRASGELEKLLETWEARLLRLKLDHRVTVAPSEEEAAALTQRSGDPLIARVAGELVKAASPGDGEEAAIARLALRELHALIPHS